MISLVFSMTESAVVYAEEKVEEPITEYYGPRDGVEIEELRTETAKQYLLPDGTMQYIGSPERIHWKDESGKYNDIDNTIIDTEYWANDFLYTHKNKSNDIRMYFADDNGDNDYPIRIEYREYSISYGMEDTQLQYILQENEILPSVLLQTVNTENAVVYSTDQGYNLVYIPKNSGEKEYIVLHSPEESVTFVFSMKLEGLRPEQYDNSVVMIDNNGEVIFTMGNLFAIDSSCVYSDSVVSATLLDFNEEIAQIQISIDDDWLNDPMRTYPVIIDPTEMVCGEYVTRDTFISGQNTNGNYYVDDYLYTGNYGTYGECRTFIAFDNPSINYSSITSATVNLRLANSSGSWSAIPAYEITTDWQSAYVTWNSQPSANYTQSVVSAPVADTWHDTSNWYCWDVATLIGNWLANYNYGIVLKPTNIYSSNWAQFYSSDYGYPNRPELMINYISGTSNAYVHSARLIGTPMASNTHNHYSYMSVVSSYLQGYGYYVASGYNSYNVGQINSILTDGSYSVCVIKAHGESISGGKSRFVINESSGLWYSSQNILNQGSNALSDYQLIVFICCYSAAGNDNGYNLPSAAKNKGAKATVGFTGYVSCTYSTYWVEDLFDSLTDGLTLLIAIEYVKYHSSYSSQYQNSCLGLTSVKPMGNTGMTLE